MKKYQMYWNKHKNSWVKTYSGKQYWVSPSQLSHYFKVPVPRTKEGSFRLANLWWEQKKKRLDSVPLRVCPPTPGHGLLEAVLSGDWDRIRKTLEKFLPTTTTTTKKNKK